MFHFLEAVVGENTGRKLIAVELSKPENQLKLVKQMVMKKLKPGHEKMSPLGRVQEIPESWYIAGHKEDKNTE